MTQNRTQEMIDEPSQIDSGAHGGGVSSLPSPGETPNERACRSTAHGYDRRGNLIHARLRFTYKIRQFEARTVVWLSTRRTRQRLRHIESEAVQGVLQVDSRRRKQEVLVLHLYGCVSR